MNWIKRALLPVIVITFSCFFGAFLFEIGLRLANHNNPWNKTEEANILKDFQFSYDVSGLYKSHLLSVDYVRNNYGLRDACGSPKEIDILTIGGSTTDQRYVSFDFTYQAVLEKRLDKAVEGFGCVSNAGVDGHSTWGHIFSFEYWFPLIPDLNPKFIMLYVGLNDANFLSANKPNSGFDNNERSGIKAFLKRFEVVKALLPIYRLLRQSYVKSSATYAGHARQAFNLDDYTVTEMNERTLALSRENADAFKSRMTILLDKIRALNAIPICVTQPHRYVITKNGQRYGIPKVLGEGFSGIDYDYSVRQLNSIMFELCGESALDLYSHSFLNTHFYDGAHTTPLGSQEVGERLADFMITKFF